MSRNDHSCRNLLSELYSVSFALDDVTLYLDTHPDCAEALGCFDNLRALEKNLTDEINASYFPLTAAANSSCAWEWVKGPWPWEGEY